MSTPAYFIFDAVLTNPEGMGPYLAKVEAAVAAYGGTRIVMGGTVVPYEGNPPKGLIVVLQFPSLEVGKAWYVSPEYQAIIGYRHASATCDAFLVEGEASKSVAG